MKAIPVMAAYMIIEIGFGLSGDPIHGALYVSLSLSLSFAS